jgi:ubiquinone/menaquinone biosynthesis C-methylase UbiE
MNPHRHLRSEGATAKPGWFCPGLGCHLLTPAYDAVTGLLGFGRRYMTAVAARIDIDPEERLLDLGCGTGILLAAIAARQPSAVLAGIDPDPRMLAPARRRLSPAVALHVGFAQELPFLDASIDVAVSTLVFHHLTDPVKAAALAEVRRVLTPAGRLHLVDFGAPTGRLSATLLRLGSVFDGRASTRVNLAGQLPRVLAEAGFAVQEIAPAYRGVRHLRCTPVGRPDSGVTP